MSVPQRTRGTPRSAMTASVQVSQTILRTHTSAYGNMSRQVMADVESTYSIVQSPTDLAIATQFATMLRDGQIGGTKFSKVVGVGHSYGSVQMQALTASAPQLLDGVLLQGFSMNT